MLHIVPVINEPTPNTPNIPGDPNCGCADEVAGNPNGLFGSGGIKSVDFINGQLVIVTVDGQTFQATVPTGFSDHKDLQNLQGGKAATVQTPAEYLHLDQDLFNKVKAFFNPFKNPVATIDAFPAVAKDLPLDAVVKGSITPNDGLVTGIVLKRNGVIWKTLANQATSFSYQDVRTYKPVTYSLEISYSNLPLQVVTRATKFTLPAFAGIGPSTLNWFMVEEYISFISQYPDWNAFVEEEGPKTSTYSNTVAKPRMFFLYPKVWGTIKSIMDETNADVKASFSVQEVNRSYFHYDSPQEDDVYYLLMNDADAQSSNFKLTFNFN